MSTSRASDKPAYMIVSGTVRKPDEVGPYAEAAEPLAKQAGMEMLVMGQPILLEGQWTHQGQGIVVEKYKSMSELLRFWNSPEYQEAKMLRDGVVDIDFIIAVEASE